MKRAVIYARYSTNKQREESIEGQIRVCREMLEKMGYVVVHIYTDRAESGKTDDRQEFQEMMKDAENGLFDAIFCYKNDRFARNKYDAVLYKHKLKKLNIKVYFAAEPQVAGPEGIILESMLEGFAEYFSANLAVNVKRGMKENALNNQYNGGPVPIGYTIDENKQYVIDEATAPIVYEVFKRYSDGQTIKSIYDYLNGLGFTTTAGKPFSKGSICSIVNNEKYTGEYVYNLGDGDKVINKTGLPAIIGLDLWNKAKARQRVNIGNTNQGKHLYLLTGRFFCDCGSGMCGSRIKSPTGYYYYYRCHQKTLMNCKGTSGNMPCHVIDNAVFGVIFEKVLTDENIKRIAAAIDKKANQKKSAPKVNYDKQKKEIEKKIKNMLDAIEMGIITPTTKTRLEELETQRAALEFEAEKENAEYLPFEAERIVTFLSSLKNGDIEDDLFKKDIAEILIKQVKMFKKGLCELTLNFGGGVGMSIIISYTNHGKWNIEAENYINI